MPKRPGGRAVRRSAGREIQLRWLAHARSGDKGDTANVGLIALKPEWYELIRTEVTLARVKKHFKGMVSGVERFELPNLRASTSPSTAPSIAPGRSPSRPSP